MDETNDVAQAFASHHYGSLNIVTIERHSPTECLSFLYPNI